MSAARWSFVAVSFLMACNTGLDLPGGSTSQAPGQDLGSSADLTGSGEKAPLCSSATTAASCDALAGCSSMTCDQCGGTVFAACVATGSSIGIDCPTIPCPSGPPDCTQLMDGPSCDARPDCYATYSGEEPCNSSGCQNHFLTCESGTPTCPSITGICNGPMRTCPPGFSHVSPTSSGLCAILCVPTSKCALPD